MKNYVQEGDILTLTAPYTVLSGGGVLVGSLFGVACGDATSGDTDLEIATEGVFEMAKTANDNVTAGEKLYWDNSAKTVTVTSSGNTFIGLATEASGTSATTVLVKLCKGVIGATGSQGDTGADGKSTLTLDIANLNDTVPDYVVAPIAGTISKIYGVVLADATGLAAVAALTTVTVKINGTGITNGVLTIAENAVIGEMDQATPSALKTVAAGDVISAVSSGADTNEHPYRVSLVITPT